MEQPKEQIEYIPLALISADPQVRKSFPADELAMMSRSLSEAGQLSPIRVRRVAEGFKIIDGELRSRAARMAGWTHLSAIIESRDLTPGSLVQQQLIANISRVNLEVTEKARGIQDLIAKTGWSASEAAARLGMTSSTVSRLLSLLTLDDELLSKVESGELPASSAYELSKVEDVKARADLANQALSGRLTRDALSGKLKAVRKPTSSGGESKALRVTAWLNQQRSVTVAANPLTLDSMIDVLEDLLTKARSARTKGLALTTFCKVLADQSRQ